MTKRTKAVAKVDVTEELIASMEEAVRIVAGEVPAARVHHLPTVPDVDVRAARERLGLSQPMFAVRFGVPLATLRKWEQGKRRPDGPARVLLRVIEREPEAVQRALAANT